MPDLQGRKLTLDKLRVHHNVITRTTSSKSVILQLLDQVTQLYCFAKMLFVCRPLQADL